MNTELFDRDILNMIAKKLRQKKQTIAAAESVTSGLLQFALSAAENARLFYHGGLTAYNLAQKFSNLDVEPIHADAVNCVSQKVAEEMAVGIANRFKSDWGIGITGYASPVPESGNKVFAYFAISFKNRIKGKGKMTPAPQDPVQLQIHYVRTVIKRLAKLV